MNQEKKKAVTQVLYNGRWVDKDTFTAFVYGEKGQKLVQSYKQFEDMIATGLWFESVEKHIESVKKRLDKINAEVIDLKKSKARKPKHGANSQAIHN